MECIGKLTNGLQGKYERILMYTTIPEWIIKEIRNERIRQDEKWNTIHLWGMGDCSSPMVDEPVKVAVLAEECGEVARAVLERDNANLKTELIQVAAVAVAWLEMLENT